MVTPVEPVISKRIFVGGLTENFTADELAQRFSHFGKVSNVSFKKLLDDDGKAVKCFAHLNLEGSEGSIKKCFSSYQNTKWKGSVMVLQYAKESVLERLQKEREENKTALNDSLHQPKTRVATTRSEVVATVKGVPGTPVPGKKDWVVGKYGRALPILKLKKSYKIPMVKYDPSKFCHAAKVFKPEDQESFVEKPCTKLTWEINHTDSDVTKKRKGEFPMNKTPHKTRTVKDNLKIIQEVQRCSIFPDDGAAPFQDLEIVKVGADVGRGKRSSTRHTSNKFDSDVESESESAMGSAKKKQAKQLTETSGSVSNRNSSVSKKLAASVQVSNGFTKASTAIPEFKGLSMLVGLDQKITQAAKATDNVKQQLSPKVSHVSAVGQHIRTESVLPDVVTEKSKHVTSHVADKVSTQSHSSQEKKAVDSPSPKKVVPPNKLEPPRKKQSLHSSQKNQSYNQFELSKSVPEFKGLGMLVDFQIQPKAEQFPKLDKSLNQALKSSEPEDKMPISGSMSTEKKKKLVDPNSHVHLQNRTRAGSEESSKIEQEGEADDNFPVVCHNGSGLKKRKSMELEERPSVKKKKRLINTDKERQHDMTNDAESISITQLEQTKLRTPQSKDADSDCSTGTDEIIFHHKAKNSTPVSGVAPELVISLNVQRPGPFVIEKDTEKDEVLDITGVQKRLARLADDEIVQGKTFAASGPNKNLNVGKPTEPGRLSEHAKHKEANERRLEAMREQARQRQQQQKLMKEAFRKVDSAKENTRHTVFESNSDCSDNEETTTEDIINIAEISHKNVHVEKEAASNSKKGLDLFASSSDEDDDDSGDENFEEMFKSKRQFEGKKGERLLKLEKSFGGDKRFKLDAKFADTDSEKDDDGEGEEEKESENLDPSDLTKSLGEEKSVCLKVLENIVGKSNLDRFSEKINRNTKKIIDMNSVRFDPSKHQPKHPNVAAEENVKARTTAVEVKSKSKQSFVEVSKEKEEEKLKNPLKVAVDTENNKSEGEGIHFGDQGDSPRKKKEKIKKEKGVVMATSKSSSQVEVSSSLLDMFKSKAQGVLPADGEAVQSFSLLQQFGSVDSGDEEESDMQATKNHMPVNSEKPGIVQSSQATRTMNATTARGEDHGVKETSRSSQAPADMDTSVNDQGGLSASESSSNDDDDEEDKTEDEDEAVYQTISDISASQDLGKEKDGIDADMLKAGRVDVRFTKKEWLEQWDTLRQSIIKMYKRKHKASLKKKKIYGEAKRKRDYIKNSRKSPGTKKKWGSFKKR